MVDRLDFDGTVDFVRQIYSVFGQNGYSTQEEIGNGLVIEILRSDACYVHVRIADTGGSPSAAVQILGGGAFACTHNIETLTWIFSKCVEFDWGAPFAGSAAGGMAFGLKSSIPSDILSWDERSIGFLMRIIEAIGQSARAIGSQFIEVFGGTLFGGDSALDHNVLLISSLGFA